MVIRNPIKTRTDREIEATDMKRKEIEVTNMKKREIDRNLVMKEGRDIEN